MRFQDGILYTFHRHKFEKSLENIYKLYHFLLYIFYSYILVTKFVVEFAEKKTLPSLLIFEQNFKFVTESEYNSLDCKFFKETDFGRILYFDDKRVPCNDGLHDFINERILYYK